MPGVCGVITEGRASASTIGEKESARSAEGRAHASIIGEEESARSAEGRASASTIGKGACAGSARNYTDAGHYVAEAAAITGCADWSSRVCSHAETRKRCAGTHPEVKKNH